METGHQLKVSSEIPEKRGIDFVTSELVVERVIHCITAAPIYTAELQWFKHLWNHEKMLKITVFRANECLS